MTDVLLRHTADGGEISYVNGQAVMAEGLETAAYLSLFGGNEDDSGGDETKHLEWWANKTEPDEANHYRSRTQHLLRGLPAIPANLRRIEDAIRADLQWMLDTELASSVEAEVSMTAPKRINIEISIVVADEEFVFEREMVWSGT